MRWCRGSGLRKSVSLYQTWSNTALGDWGFFSVRAGHLTWPRSPRVVSAASASADHRHGWCGVSSIAGRWRIGLTGLHELSVFFFFFGRGGGGGVEFWVYVFAVFGG